jgi:hypothetical protein
VVHVLLGGQPPAGSLEHRQGAQDQLVLSTKVRGGGMRDHHRPQVFLAVFATKSLLRA